MRFSKENSLFLSYEFTEQDLNSVAMTLSAPLVQAAFSQLRVIAMQRLAQLYTQTSGDDDLKAKTHEQIRLYETIRLLDSNLDLALISPTAT
jgi:hypothetical protein